jgi:hypothetical protein
LTECRRLQGLLETEIEAHGKIKNDMNQIQTMLTKTSIGLSQEEAKVALLQTKLMESQDLSQQHQQQELFGLREQNIDQSEQIQVLVSELSKLRNQTNAGTVGSSLAVEEITRLESEAKLSKTKYEALQKAFESQKLLLLDGNKGGQEQGSKNLDRGNMGQSGNFATPQVGRGNVETAQLNALLTQMEHSETILKQRCLDSEAKTAAIEREKQSLMERTERLCIERDEALTQLDSKQHEINEYRDRIARQMGDEGVRDAHVWWSYVWHEMKRQSISNPQGTAVGDIDGFSSQIDSHGEGQAIVMSKKLRENLRAQAIELTSIRQELLGRQLTFKREAEVLKERVVQSERELGRVTSAARLHKEDKEMKIAEMAATIHMLTGKGDMYGQAAAARQDLLSERLAVHHLRDDVDSYRSMLDSEQNRVVALRKELLSMQGAAESLSVLNTLVDLPGVSAESLMEIMSGKIITIQNEMNTSKAIAAQAQSETNQLRRVLAAAPTPPSTHTGALRSRSESPSGRSRPQRLDNEGDQDASMISKSKDQFRSQYLGMISGMGKTGGDGRLSKREARKGRGGIAFSEEEGDGGNMSALSLVVDGETTPQVLLDSLNAATMAQNMRSQEELICSLRAQLEEAHEGILVMTSVS